MKNDRLRAYVLYDRHDTGDGHQAVVFARTARDARRGGHLDDVAYVDLGARRAPSFDAWAGRPGPIPPAAYIANGWWLECSACSDLVDQDRLDAGGVVTDADAYCDERCQARDEGRTRGHRFRRAEVDAAEAEARRRWPDAEVCWRGFNERAWREPFPAGGFRVGVRLWWKATNAYANWDEGDAGHSPLEVYGTSEAG